MKVDVVNFTGNKNVRGGVESLFDVIAKELNGYRVTYEDVCRCLGIPFKNYSRYAILDRVSDFEEYYKRLEEAGINPDFIIADDCVFPFFKPNSKLITIVSNTYLIASKILLHAGFYNLDMYKEFGYVYTNLQKLQLEKSDVIIANSEFTRMYVEDLGYKAKVVNLGVDEDLFKPRRIKKERDVLFVTKFHPIKGFHVSVNLARHMKDLNFTFILAHDIKRNESIMNNVEIKTNLSKEFMAIEYNRHKLTVCPYVCESFNLVAIESMMSNTPVLTTRTGYFHTFEEGWYDFGVVSNEVSPKLIKEMLKNREEFKPRKWAIKHKLTKDRMIRELKKYLK